MKFLVSSGHLVFKHRNALFPSVFSLMLLFSRPGFFFGDPAFDRYVVALGAAAALLGQIFRLAVIGYAYIKRGGKEGKVYADKLVVRGFYAHSRNPMYIGNLLIVAGFCLVYGSWTSYFLVLPFFLFAYLSITTAEEAYLAARFGRDYEDYCRRVNRFIPDLRGLGESLKEFHYDWKRALRKDYGTVFGTGAMLLALVLRKRSVGSDPAVFLQNFLSHPAFIGLLVFYAVSRFLKKSRRLASPD